MSGSGKQLGHVDKRINLYLDDLLDEIGRASCRERVYCEV